MAKTEKEDILKVELNQEDPSGNRVFIKNGKTNYIKQLKLTKTGRRIGFTLASIVLFILMGYLIYRLYNIQIVDGEYYSQLAKEQQTSDMTISAERGTIYDSDLNVLASSVIVWDIACDPKSSYGLYEETTIYDDASGEYVGTGEYVVIESVCSDLSRIISKILVANDGSTGDAIDVSSEEYLTWYSTVYKALSTITSNYRCFASNISLPVANAITEAVDLYNDEHDGVKVYVNQYENESRIYPYGTLASSVLGFCNSDGDGIYGLEASYNDTLAGIDGRKVTIKNVYGYEVASNAAGGSDTNAAIDGDNLVLTLNSTVQNIAEKYLDEAVYANDVENRGVCIIMDVTDGSIIAMATSNDYDPNNPLIVDDEEYLSQLVLDEPEIYASYYSDDMTGVYREIQWKNKAITEMYYPGSIFKLITAAAAIDSDVATEDTCFVCNGSYTVGNKTYSCAGKKAHGEQTMTEAIKNSCNIYFVQLAEAMGEDIFYEYYNAFGLDESTGIDLPYEATNIQYYTPEKMGVVELASSSFGQSMSITPIQLCTSIAACVNGGYLITPHVVDYIVDDDMNVVEDITGTIVRQAISEETSEIMMNMMVEEVGDGTSTSGGYRAFVSGYSIGGKTGTSELLNMDLREDGDYKKASAYIGVFPEDDPQYLVYLMLDDPNNESTDYASTLAAPTVGSIISEIAPYLGVQADDSLEGTIVKVPSLVGKTWSMAQVDLNIIGLDHELVGYDLNSDGQTVLYQYPAAGTEVLYGTTIYMYLAQEEGNLIEVPDVVGKSQTFAIRILEAAGLNYAVDENCGDNITSQSIGAGEFVETGEVIVLY